jgi:DNA replication protein DnaC
MASYKCEVCRDIGMVQTERGTWKECECQVIEKAKRRMENSGLRPDQRTLTFSTYKCYDETTSKAATECKQYVINYDTIKTSTENSLCLLGNAGAGKTHLAVSIATNLINRKENPVPVVYMPYLETMQELKTCVLDEEYYFKLSMRYKDAKLLIIDDLFKDKVRNGRLIGAITEPDMKHIYPIINYRYLNNLPFVISSECTPEMLMELDEALAGRIIQKSRNFTTVFRGREYDYRLRYLG